MNGSSLINKKVFVVDDSDIILAQVSRILRKIFYVQTFNAASKMLNIARTMPVYPDMIMLDTEMPDMNSYEVLRKINEIPIWKDIPILIMTSWDSDAVLRHFFEMGALDIIFKPLIPSVVLNRVEKYMMLSKLIQGEYPSPLKIYAEDKLDLARIN